MLQLCNAQPFTGRDHTVQILGIYTVWACKDLVIQTEWILGSNCINLRVLTVWTCVNVWILWSTLYGF